VLDVATLDMSQDNILEKIKTLFSNIAANGANTLNDESRRLAQQAYVVVDLDLVQAKSFVTISLLFVTQSEADAALAKFNAYGGTSKFLDDVVVDMTVPPSISFQSNPVINTFTLSTTANPIPIQQSGLQIDHISFKNDCLDSGCWVIDFTTAKFSDAGSHTLALLPQIVDGVGDLPTPSSYPCLRDNACCLSSLLDSYYVTEPFDEFLQGTAYTTECAAGGANDGLIRNMGVVEFGTMAGLVSKIEPRMDPDVGGSNYRLFLDEQELLTKVGQHAGGTVALGYSADLVLGVAQISASGDDIVDTMYTQHALRLARNSVIYLGAHGSQAATFVESVELVLHSVRDAIDAPSTEWPAIDFAEVRFSLKDNYRAGIASAFVAPNSVRVGRSETEGITWALPPCWAAVTGDEFGERMGQYCAPDVTMCGNLDIDPETLEASYYLPLGDSSLLDTATATGNSSLVVEFVVSADSDSGELGRTRVSVSLPIQGLSSTMWCEGAVKSEALQHVSVDLSIFDFAVDWQGNSDPSESDLFTNADGVEVSSAVTDLIHESSETNFAQNESRTALGGGFMILSAQGDELYDRVSMQNVCPEIAAGVIIHILEFSGNTLAQVEQLFADGEAVVINNAWGSKSITPTQALLNLCPTDPPADADPNTVVTINCVTSLFSLTLPTSAEEANDGALITVPAIGALNPIEVQPIALAVAEYLLGEMDLFNGVVLLIAGLAFQFLTDNRKSQAWMVHAGRKWANTEKSYQSSAVIVRLAFDMNENCQGVPVPDPLPFRRSDRGLLEHSTPQQQQRRSRIGTPAQQLPNNLGVIGTKMKGLGTPIKPIAGKLGIDEELVTVWTMSETTGSCLSASEMKASFSKRAQDFLGEGGRKPAQLFNVLSVVCTGGARRAEKATATYETVIALTDKENEAQHIRDIQRISEMPGVTGVEGLFVPEVPPEEDSDSGMSTGMLAGIIAGAAVVVLGLAAGLFLVMKRKKQGAQEQVADRAVHSSLKDSLHDELRNMEAGGLTADDLLEIKNGGQAEDAAKKVLAGIDASHLKEEAAAALPNKNEAREALKQELDLTAPGAEGAELGQGNKITL